MASESILETYRWLRANGFMKGDQVTTVYFRRMSGGDLVKATDLAVHSLAIGALVKVRGFSGVACTYVGPEIERFWDLDEGIFPDDPEERETGRAIVVMVGDDHKHTVDFDDMTVIEDNEDICSCGQLGCAAESINHE